jgi:hypothetical protein
VGKWSTLNKPIKIAPGMADTIGKCLCVLHNTIDDEALDEVSVFE